MNEENVRLFLRSLKIDYKRETHNGQWLNIKCPFAQWLHVNGTDNTPSFGIMINDKGRSAFKCWSCNSKGSLARLATLLAKYRKTDYQQHMHWAEMTESQVLTSTPLLEWEQFDATEAISDEVDALPDQTTLHEYPLAEVPSALKYLSRRGLTWWDVIRLDIRYDEYAKRVLFPVWDENGKLRGMSGRIINDKLVHKKNPKIRDYAGLPKKRFMLASRRIKDTLGVIPGTFGKQIITEGLLDFANMYHHGFVNARANMGTAYTQEKADILIRAGLPVFFLFDDDKAGEDAVLGNINNETGEIDYSLSWANNLYMEIPVWICQYRGSAAGKDPGELTKDEAIDCVESARLYTEKFERLK